jgi:molecular chaperone GrpE
MENTEDDQKNDKQKHVEEKKPEEVTDAQKSDETNVNSADEKVGQKPEDEKTSSKEEKPAADETAKKITTLEKQISDLKTENAELKDQILRRAADFDNYRKRMLKEKQDAFDYANTNLLQDLLISLDNFDRTVEAASSSKDVKSIADGVKMINENLVKLLEDRYNLCSYGVAGDKFNPDEHQAIGSVQGPVAEPVLKEVYLRGYKLKDRVIRHAKVMVTMPDGTVKPKEEKKEEKKTAEPEKEAEKK